MTKSEIVKRFGKATLLSLADELELDVSDGTHVYKVIGAITDDIDNMGVPDVDDMSDDLFDLVFALGFIDEDGELVDDEPDDNPDSESEPDDEAPLPKRLPGCWGQGDPNGDPTCKKCAISARCVKVRQANRPACFGNLYDENHDKCRICLYWRSCMDAM